MSTAHVTGHGPLIEFRERYRQWKAGDCTDMYTPGVADVLVNRRKIAVYVADKAVDAPPNDKRMRRRMVRNKATNA